MKPSIPIATAFLLTLCLAAPLNALAQVTNEQILQACANDQIRTLPMPFSDVPTDHWAADAVMKLYYCGPLRGAIATAELEKLQQREAKLSRRESQVSEIAALPTIKTLLSAPNSVEIEGRQYVLETYLWRDFMPMSPPDGKPLMASLRVIATDKQAFPTSLKVDRFWAIKSDREVWETPLNSEASQPAKNQLEKVARNGPSWQPGTSVDVIIRLIDSQNRTYLLKADRQPIEQTN